MKSELLIIAGLGIGYYIFVKKDKYKSGAMIGDIGNLHHSGGSPIEKEKRYKVIPKKTLKISTVTDQPIIQPIVIKPVITPEEAKEQRLEDIISQSKIIAETSTDTAYADMAARFVAQEAAKVAAAAKIIADATAAKIAATAAALKQKRYDNIIAESERIAASSGDTAYADMAAKFLAQERAAGRA